MQKTKLTKTANYIIKILIIILSFGFIIQRLFIRQDTNDFLTGMGQIFSQPDFLLLLIPVVVIMPLNWSLESLKWRFLIKKIENITFVKSFIAVFAGITIGTFTPNRSGENLGRAFILDHANRWEGIFITFIGSLSQILITILFGTLSFLYFFISRHAYFIDHSYHTVFSLLCFAIIISVFTLILYFRISWLEKFILWFVPKKYGLFISHLKVFEYYNTSELLKVLFFSFCRYILFALQFYLLLLICQINFNLFDGLVYISLMYLLITAIPTFTLSEIGVRGSVGIFLMQLFFCSYPAYADQLADKALLASFLIWIINLIIPALIGEFFILKLKFVRK
jgi:uncharacterized membrane protein YbhN (UPF0104 family)